MHIPKTMIHLDVVDVDLVVVPELERTLALLLAKRVRLVDLGVLW